jgi:hypothetical protein
MESPVGKTPTASIGSASLPLPPGPGPYQVRYYANGRVAAVSGGV